MRVRFGPISWKVTAPSTWPFSPLERHTMRSSGTCSRIVRLPRPVAQEDLRLEVELVVVLGLDALDLLHEARERAELGPLVVGDRDRDADVDGLDDVGRLGGLAAAALAAATAGDLVLDAGGGALEAAHHGESPFGLGLAALRDGLADRAAVGDVLELVGQPAQLVADGAQRLVAQGLEQLLASVLQLVHGSECRCLLFTAAMVDQLLGSAARTGGRLLGCRLLGGRLLGRGLLGGRGPSWRAPSSPRAFLAGAFFAAAFFVAWSCLLRTLGRAFWRRPSWQPPSWRRPSWRAAVFAGGLLGRGLRGRAVTTWPAPAGAPRPRAPARAPRRSSSGSFGSSSGSSRPRPRALRLRPRAPRLRPRARRLRPRALPRARLLGFVLVALVGGSSSASASSSYSSRPRTRRRHWSSPDGPATQRLLTARGATWRCSAAALGGLEQLAADLLLELLQLRVALDQLRALRQQACGLVAIRWPASMLPTVMASLSFLVRPSR